MVHPPDYLTKDIKWRVRDYLSRVRYLHFSVVPSSKERALWQTLQAFHWMNPLCPNLRGITFKAGYNYPSMTHHLVPLLVPSLRSIRFDSAGKSWDEEAVSMLLSLIQHREVQVSDIVYAGYASRRIVKHIFQLPKLRSVKVLATSGYSELLDASDVQSFRPSTLLTNLDIDVGIFQPTSKVGGWIETLQSLSTLSLQGAASLVIDCLQERKFAVVHSLTLFLSERRGVTTVPPNIFTVISTAFPILHSLCLENRENYNITNAAITLSDIHALRERPMRCLVITGLQLSLSLTNIIDVVKTWPSLERLSLLSVRESHFEKYCAYKLLPYISRYAPHIADLNLPLKMSSSITSQPLIATATVCPLQRLELTQVKNFPSRLDEQLMLGRNLVTLFPRLDVVTSNVDIRQLQVIVNSFRGMLSSPPRRGDNLY
jgi:hypothetical protein